MRTIYTLLLCAACLFGVDAWGQLSITSLPANYSNNFNSYNPNSASNVPSTINSTGTGSGIASVTSTGWTATLAGTPTNPYNGQSTGSSNTGGYYGYGSASDFSLGALRSAATGNITYVVSFTNNSTATITSLTFSWEYKQFRYGGNTSGWDCAGTGQLAANSTIITKSFTGASSGTNGTVTTTSISSFTLNSLSIATGQTFGISWTTTAPGGSNNGIAIDNFSMSASDVTLSTPPTLNAATSATVDNPFTVTFTDNPAWRAAITSVNYSGTPLTAGTDYTISAGQITLIPAATNPMSISGTKNLNIKATGYSNDIVAQTINSGVPVSPLTIITQPAAPSASGGTLTTAPVINAIDKYGNNSVGYTINAVVTTGQGTSWSLGGTTGVTTNSAGNATFTGLTATNNTAAPYPATITFSYVGLSVTSNSFTIPAVAPTLTAAPSATVDAPFNVTFTDNPSWRGAITSVTYNGIALVSGTDYTISAGQITLIPTATNPMRTPGTKNLVITATGYNVASVSQTINAGAPFTLTVTTQPTAPPSYNALLATQPKVKAVDKYGNPVTGTYTITASVTTGQTGSWTLSGTTAISTVSGVATYTDLAATNLTTSAYTASITFSYGSATVTSNTFVIPAPPPSNDDCSGAITITPATSPTPVTGTLVSSTPTAVTLGYQPSKNDVWYKFIPPCTGSYTVNINYTFTTGVILDFDVYAGSCPSAGAIGDPFGHNHAATGLQTKTANLTSGVVYYLRVIDYGSVSPGSFTVSVVANPPPQPSVISGGSTTPCLGNSETYAVTPIAGITYAWTLPGADWSGSSNTSSITTTVGSTAGNLIVTPTNGCGMTGTPQTLAVTPVTSPLNVTGASVNPSNGRVTISWTNPADCFDEIMVIATDNSSNVTLVPSGDGSQYIDTTEFASAYKNNAANMNTGEYCIYKGISTAVVMTGLLNGNPYNIKIFTRWGTQWSSGVTISNIRPAAAFTGAYKSIKSGLWNDFTTWNKFDGTNWIATSGATDYPSSYQSDVTIEAGTVVRLTISPVAVKNLEVKPTAQLWTSTADTTNKYLTVYGDITCDGVIGNINPNNMDYISFNFEGSSSTITGTGTFSCARIRKEFTAGTVGGSNNTTLNINKDINLLWKGTALYNDADNDTLNYTKFNVNLNYPYKLTLKQSNGNVTVDGLYGSNFNSRTGGKFTINGTLTIPGMLYLTTDNSSAGPNCMVEIGSTGVINAAIVNVPASGTAGHTFTIKNGGLLNVTDTSGFVQFNPKNNFINLNAGSTVQFSGGNLQQVLSGLNYWNLTIAGTGEKLLSNQYANMIVNGNLAINPGVKLNLNGRVLNLNGTINGTGTITGSATSSISIGPNTTLTSTPLGVLRFTPGRDSLNTLTMDRQMKSDNYPNHKYWAAVLGSNVNVASLKLNQGILATDKYLLTLQNYNNGDYATYNGASYVATTDTLATAFTVGNTFSGSYGFRIKGVKSNTDTYFPVGADFISPNRAMVNLGSSAATRDMTIVLTKGDIGYTGSPRVNRIWYMYSSVADSINANMRLYYTGYDLATYPYTTKQDELETSFTGTSVRLLQKAFLSDNYFINISNNADIMFNGSPNNEVYAKYTRSSVIYNGTNPGIWKFSVFSIVSGDNVVLPVSFTAIRAYQQGSNINVSWAVANEINIDHYEVERASDGRLFNTVATQSAHNTADAGNSYIAADLQPLTGANYYRIKAVSKDGQVIYSTVVNITLSSDGKASLLVYPNPIKNKQCNVQLSNLAAGSYNLSVYSMSGQVIALKQIEHAGGSSNEKLNLPPGTAAGVYVVKLDGQNVHMQSSVFVSEK